MLLVLFVTGSVTYDVAVLVVTNAAIGYVASAVLPAAIFTITSKHRTTFFF